MMANQEILGGLRLAINRGESLQKAMTTFYNAGYKKEEIEEAAKVIHQEQFQISQVPKEVKPIKKLDKEKIKLKPAKKVSAYGESEKKSARPAKPIKKAGRWLLITIITVAVIFIGLLIAFLLST